MPIKTETKTVFELTEEEMEWLRIVIQKPNGDSGTENAEHEEMRRIFWEALWERKQKKKKRTS